MCSSDGGRSFLGVCRTNTSGEEGMHPFVLEEEIYPGWVCNHIPGVDPAVDGYAPQSGPGLPFGLLCYQMFDFK